MVKEVEVSKVNAGVAATAQPEVQPTVNNTGAFNGLGTATSWDKSFGLVSISSMAGAFCAALDELKKENPNLNQFKYGVVESISNSDFGSAAFVAGQYNGAWLYGLVLFEKGDSFRITTNNNVESYYTIPSLVNEKVRDAISADLQKNYGMDNLHHMALNTVPDLGKTMDPQWAIGIMGQMLMGIFGRAPGYLGKLTLGKADRFNLNVAEISSGSVIDANGHAQRADFGILMTHQSQNTDQNEATLLSDGQGKVVPRTKAAGFVNLRFTGVKKEENGVINRRQMQGEVVVSLMDSQQEGSSVPYERQLLTLAGFADIAARGGWRDIALGKLNKSDRKFSALAQYLVWGTDTKVDVSKLDGNKELLKSALEMFCPSQAALVISHRAANGLGGLSTLMAEVAVGSDNALAQLLSILDGMFPADANGGKFRNWLAAALGKPERIVAQHIISAAVPTIAGQYVQDGQKRSYADMDLVSVATHLGDKQADVVRYLHAQSFYNRELDEHQQRLYLLRLSVSMYASRDGRATGESLDMATNPVFAKVLLESVRKHAGTFQLNGVNEYDSASNALFFDEGKTNLTLSGSNNGSALSDFGLNLGGTSSFNF